MPAIALIAPRTPTRLAVTTRLIEVATATGALFALAWQFVFTSDATGGADRTETIVFANAQTPR